MGSKKLLPKVPRLIDMDICSTATKSSTRPSCKSRNPAALRRFVLEPLLKSRQMRATPVRV